MPQLIQMLQDQLRRAHLVQHYVGDTGNLAVSGYGYDRNRKLVLKNGVDADEALDGAGEKQPWILLEQVFAAAMAGDEIEVALLDENIFHPLQHLRGVAIAKIGDQHADRK